MELQLVVQLELACALVLVQLVLWELEQLKTALGEHNFQKLELHSRFWKIVIETQLEGTSQLTFLLFPPSLPPARVEHSERFPSRYKPLPF